MAHSPAYFAAAGVADLNSGGLHASAAKIADPVIHRLIDKVSVGPQPTGDAARYRQGAMVTIHTRDGRSFISTVYAPKGSAMLGIAWTDIEAKYRDVDAEFRLDATRIEESLAMIRNFSEAGSVSPLVERVRAR